jgi:hypothetical protein
MSHFRRALAACIVALTLAVALPGSATAQRPCESRADPSEVTS